MSYFRLLFKFVWIYLSLQADCFWVLNGEFNKKKTLDKVKFEFNDIKNVSMPFLPKVTLQYSPPRDHLHSLLWDCSAESAEVWRLMAACGLHRSIGAF